MFLDVDFFASVRRRRATLDTRPFISMSYNSDVTHDDEPTSCDDVTMLSLPLFHSLQRSTPAGNPIPVPGNSGRQTDEPMSTSLLARNESWSSFSSLHSLPEPFLCRNRNNSTPRGIPDAFRGITPIDGWHEMRRDAGLRPAPPLINGYALEDPRINHTSHNVVGRQPTNGLTNYLYGQSNDSGTLRASSVGHEIDSFGDDDQSNSRKTRTSVAADRRNVIETVRSPSSRPMNAVLGRLVRAKSVTSKTLRKFGPKFSGSTKSVGNAEPSSLTVKSAVVRRSSSIAQRFRAFRQQQTTAADVEVGRVDSKQRLHSLWRPTERSPLTASDTSSGRVPNSFDSVVASPKPDTAAPQRDPLRRVLFSTTALKDGRKFPESAKNRLSFHGRDRMTSCGDSMTSGFSVMPAVRPRSTEPPSQSVRVEPTVFQMDVDGGPLMRQSWKSTDTGSSPVMALSSATSPRMASPESSSLSSGSPVSVFAGVPPCGSSRHMMRDSNPRLPSPTASMSDLSLWEMPKLDIDLIDQMFVGHDSTSEPGVFPVIMQTSTPALQISPPLSVDPSHRLNSDICNESSQRDLSTATKAN